MTAQQLLPCRDLEHDAALAGFRFINKAFIVPASSAIDSSAGGGHRSAKGLRAPPPRKSCQYIHEGFGSRKISEARFKDRKARPWRCAFVSNKS